MGIIDLNFLRSKFFKPVQDVAVWVQYDSLYDLIEALYKQEVERTGHEYMKDNFVVGIIMEIVKWLQGNFTSCIISGGVGLGKTAMLRCLMRIFDDVKDPISIPPSPYRKIMYVEAAEFSLKSVRDHSLLEEACNCKILLIDDLGSEEMYYMEWGNKICPIKNVIMSRYTLRLPTIFTTNLSPDDIPDRYGDRVADRLNELYEIIEYPPHESYRRRF